MNKKGSLVIGFIFAVAFFMFGMLLIPLMKDGVTDARTSVDCTNSSISDGAKAICLVGLDVGVPYFIIVVLTLAGGFIGNEL